MAAPIFKFAGMNTLADPTNIDTFNQKSAQYGQCVDIVNCDIDDEHAATMRAGAAQVFAGDVTSCWTSSAGVTYCVFLGYLCIFDGEFVTSITTDLTVLDLCEFEQLNDVVVFSDNEKIGIIDGSTVTRIDTPADWVNVEQLEQWVSTHAPANPETATSNFEVDAYALSTMAGKCLHHFGGVLYLAVDNFVYATKTFNAGKMDIRYNVIAGFPDPVTMITHVDDGLFIGTTTACYFLAGTGIVVGEDGAIKAGFKQSQVTPYGTIYGTALTIDAALVPTLRAKDLAAIWATPVGVFAGVAGGTATNLSEGKVTLSAAASGTALFKDYNGLRQYIVRLDSGAWVVNLNTLAHSRYTAYPYTSLFKQGAAYYGATSECIVEFTGNTDYVGGGGQQIDAFILTAAVDFGAKIVKWVRHVYAQVRRTAVLAIDCIVDEVVGYDGGSIPSDGISAAHTVGQKTPRGMRGVYWQFRLRNVGGGSFTVFNIEPVVVMSPSRTK